MLLGRICNSPNPVVRPAKGAADKIHCDGIFRPLPSLRVAYLWNATLDIGFKLSHSSNFPTRKKTVRHHGLKVLKFWPWSHIGCGIEPFVLLISWVKHHSLVETTQTCSTLYALTHDTLLPTTISLRDHYSQTHCGQQHCFQAFVPHKPLFWLLLTLRKLFSSGFPGLYSAAIEHHKSIQCFRVLPW